MRKATDTTLRSLAMLMAIPQHPRSKSTRQIGEELRNLDPDFDVTSRSVQRSLELSATFPITSEFRGPAKHSYWIDRNALTQIPAMSPPTALVMRLAAEYLKAVLPPAVLRHLEAYFRHADRVLGDSPLGRWRDRAMVITRGLVLTLPAIRDGVQDVGFRPTGLGPRVDRASTVGGDRCGQGRCYLK